MNAAVWAVPVLTLIFLLAGLLKKVDIVSVFCRGARSARLSAISMVPPLVLFMTVIGMFRASGALDVLAHFLSFLTKPLGLPEEVIPLALLRPVSGSASLTVFQQILDNYGPDSFAGRVASVIQSASETTFYTITVYYAAGKIRRQRHTLFCSLAGDLTVIFSASLWVRLFLKE